MDACLKYEWMDMWMDEQKNTSLDGWERRFSLQLIHQVYGCMD